MHHLNKIQNLFFKILYYISKIIKYIKLRSEISKKIDSPYERFVRDEAEECYKYFKKYFHNAIFLNNREKIDNFGIQKAIELNDKNENLFIEFGVWKGRTINNFSKFLNNRKIYGFDSFEGLKDDWLGTQNFTKGTFNLNKKIPKLNPNVVVVQGEIEKTLPKFLDSNKGSLAFIHIDTDTYPTCKFILEKVRDRLADNSIIVFDEFYNYSGWRSGEFKAFNEIMSDLNFNYLAFASFGTQVVIQITK